METEAEGEAEVAVGVEIEVEIEAETGRIGKATTRRLLSSSFLSVDDSVLKNLQNSRICDHLLTKSSDRTTADTSATQATLSGHMTLYSRACAHAIALMDIIIVLPLLATDATAPRTARA